MYRLIVLSFFYLLFANQLFAINSLDEEILDSIAVEEVTVSAFRFQEKLLKTPVAISIISEDKLKSSSHRPVSFLVNQSPGVFMQSGTLGTNRLTIRGIGTRSPYSTNKIRAYFEGIPLTNGVGETTIEDLNLAAFSKIEIIKGPSSAYYGSGLGGTLLFEAKEPKHDEIEISTTFSSYASYLQSAAVSIEDGDFQHSLHATYLNADGYRYNNKTDRSTVTYFGKLSVKNHQFNLLINHADLKAFIPSSIDLETFEQTPRKAAANWQETRGFEDYQKLMAGVSASSEWEKGWNSQAGIFANQYRNYELRPFNILEEESYYYGSRILVNKSILTEKVQTTLTFGTEIFLEDYQWATFENQDRINGEQISDNKELRNYYNVFVSGKIRFKNGIMITAGGNLNSTSYKYTDRFTEANDGTINHRFNTVLSPKLSMIYPINQKSSIYLNVSHGFSPPSIEETLLPDGKRNLDIQPETGWNYEIGSRGHLLTSIYFDISAYYMRIKNLLLSRRVGEDEYMGINAGKSEHPGIEYLFRTKIIQQTKWSAKLSHSGSYSPHRFLDFTDLGNDYSDNDLTGVPRYTNNSKISIDFGKNYAVELHHQFTGKMPLRDDNSIYSDSYSLINLDGRFKKKIGKIDIEVSAGVYNIFDKSYASMHLINANSFGGRAPRYYYPGLPRNFSLKLKAGHLF